jgi:hypothetical protein
MHLMKVLTGPTAIAIDGSALPAPDGKVAFAVGSVAAPRRPWTGLAIAVVTAAVTMGAMGPKPAAEALAAACPPPAIADQVDDGRVALATPAAARPVASPTSWWLLPQARWWVDPATGMTMQATPAPPHEQDQVADDLHRDR